MLVLGINFLITFYGVKKAVTDTLNSHLIEQREIIYE